MPQLISYKEIESFLIEAVEKYEKTAPTVSRYCDELYERVTETPEKVSLREIVAISRLEENGIWFLPNQAANTVFHIMQKFGLDTTTHAGF